MQLYERAYAKINLYLDVLGKREDGFHAIRTVMQTVGLYDAVSVTVAAAAEPSVSLSVRGHYRVPVGQGNLCHRAALAYMDAAALPMRVQIRLDKHIPVAAGLGGGSADAAAVLRALNRAAGNRLATSRLLTLATELGSDVPFCLFGHTQLCEGRGEQMRRLPPLPPLPLVILPTRERVSAAAAYTALDAAYGNFASGGEHADLGAFLSALESGRREEILARLYNIFEDVVLPTCPVASENASRLAALGADAVLMSGSGATVLGFFPDAALAKEAASILGSGAIATVTV